MISADIQKLEPGARVEMYELDATELGDTIYRFHAGVNELGNDIVWQGHTYLRFPILATGFEQTVQGSQPRPTIKIANVTGVMGALLNALDDLVGARLTRKVTMLQYLDAVNFQGGINPLADPTAQHPDEVWIVDRKSAENKLYVEWELASSLDLTGVQLPLRQIAQNSCAWQYRDGNCPYSGGPVADVTDKVVYTMAEDNCSRTQTGCRLRFGTNGVLPFGGFPGSGLVDL